MAPPRRWRPVPLACAAALALAGVARAQTVGSVDAAFQALGPDHKVVVEVFDGPEVAGVGRHLSRARTGGVKGALGLAEDRADSSAARRQVGHF